MFAFMDMTDFGFVFHCLTYFTEIWNFHFTLDCLKFFLCECICFIPRMLLRMKKLISTYIMTDNGLNQTMKARLKVYEHAKYCEAVSL